MEPIHKNDVTPFRIPKAQFFKRMPDEGARLIQLATIPPSPDMPLRGPEWPCTGFGHVANSYTYPPVKIFEGR